MGCLGLHIALDEAQVATLKALRAADRVEFIQEKLEGELWSADKSRAQQTDKAWDAIHRSLTDGELSYDNGSYPLNQVILGGERLYHEDDYIISLKLPQEVRDIAAALHAMTKEKFRTGYDQIDREGRAYQPVEIDFPYTWEWFQELVTFYQRAASKGYAVLFTADQ